MKHGDFTELAKFYVDRPGYSTVLLKKLKDSIQFEFGHEIKVADVGAGTGKLTENLAEIGLSGYAVEPNDAMREEGINLFIDDNSFTWSKGTAENTGLEDNSVDWLLMGSSFHWADAEKARNEFARVLNPGGYFTAIWNPREIERSEIHTNIENMIKEYVPNMKRVSSGKVISTDLMEEKLGGVFEDIIFMECRHEEVMSIERYMNIWRSVNDIQVQAGPIGFKQIINNIYDILGDRKEIKVPYISRSWTAKCKN